MVCFRGKMIGFGIGTSEPESIAISYVILGNTQPFWVFPHPPSEKTLTHGAVTLGDR